MRPISKTRVDINFHALKAHISTRDMTSITVSNTPQKPDLGSYLEPQQVSDGGTVVPRYGWTGAGPHHQTPTIFKQIASPCLTSLNDRGSAGQDSGPGSYRVIQLTPICSKSWFWTLTFLCHHLLVHTVCAVCARILTKQGYDKYI